MMCTQGVRLVESNTLRAHLIDKGSEQVLKIPAALVNISKGPAHSYIYRSKARRTVPSVAPAGPRLPPLVRAILGVEGAAMLVFGVALLVAPVQVAKVWPWPLTALTGRAIGAWLVGLGIIAAQSWHADRRESVAIAFKAIIAYGALQLAVLAGYASSLHWDKAAAWCYLLFLVSLLAVGVAGQISVTRSGAGSAA